MYSPLEQFEPIPFFTIFIGGLNLSITNVSVIYIFIFAIISLFFNGFVANEGHHTSGRYVMMTIKSDKGNAIYKQATFLYGGGDLKEALSKKLVPSRSLSSFEAFLLKVFSSNKVVSYLSYLEKAYVEGNSIKNVKESWLGLNTFSSPNLKSEHSREFHKTLFSVLKNRSVDLSGDILLFNNIQLYTSNFLNYLNFLKIDFEPLFASLKKDSPSNFENMGSLEDDTFFDSETKASRNFIPKFNIFIFEGLYNVILNMVKENIGGSVKQVIKFVPFIFSLFLFILVANLVGLVPYSSTVTSYLVVTFAMAVMVLVGVNIIAGRHHGLVYFGHFLPAGCPFALYPLIIPIEFISYVFRVVSLSVRLFANMMAGHTLLAVLAGFGWTMVNGGISLAFLAPFPVLVVFVLVFLETAVAIIQAYVFTILTCMYLDEAINLH
jgi:ATP synthase subunit 6